MKRNKTTELVSTVAQVNGLLMAKGRATVKTGSPRIAKTLALHYMRRGAWASIDTGSVSILLYNQ